MTKALLPCFAHSYKMSWAHSVLVSEGVGMIGVNKGRMSFMPSLQPLAK